LMMVRNSTLTHYIYCLSMWQKKMKKKVDLEKLVKNI
jgi:hypothetical protein